jgi:DhnA family fructose-bisphosphate aldolase class Ia
MVESIPGGWAKADMRTPENVAAAARVASETSADYVKTFYTGDKRSFKEVLDNCSVPVLILGGPKIDTDLAILEMVHDAMDVGATGITMGRNIWGHSNIEGITSALAEIIHNDASVESAYRLIQ